MNICSDGHEEICYNGLYCPFCEAIIDARENNDTLINEINERDNHIDQLKEEINELTDKIDDLESKI